MPSSVPPMFADDLSSAVHPSSQQPLDDAARAAEPSEPAADFGAGNG